MILALFKIAVIQTFHPSISLQWDFSLVSCLLWEEVRSRLERFLHHHISFCVFYYPDGKWRVIQQFRLTVCDERSLKSTDPDMIWIGSLTVLPQGHRVFWPRPPSKLKVVRVQPSTQYSSVSPVNFWDISVESSVNSECPLQIAVITGL